ncbi:MAG TPA: hypothetical protein EYG68_06800 [Leucothrix mucor]|nr:hypothetical protein [Leucothrix mucor]
MAAMSQMQIRYNQEEDRFLLRMNTVAQEEFRFWLTRRFTALFHPLLSNSLQSSPEVKKQAAPINKEAVLSFQKEKAQSKVQYNTTFEPSPKKYPLGEQPLLISSASIKNKGKNNYLLQLSSPDNTGIDFALDQNLLHVLTGLITDALPKTNWQLEFETESKESVEKSPSLLN